MKTIKYIFIGIISLVFICCKKDKNETPAPSNNNPPPQCSASNLVVDTIIENNGQSKKYKLSVVDFTSTASTTFSNLAATFNITMTVVGDTTVLTNLPGKTYSIKGSNGWDLRAYSYFNTQNSIWYLLCLTAGYNDYFDMAYKLPLTANTSYSAGLGSNNQTFNIGYPDCIMVNYQNYPVFFVGNNYYSGFPTSYTRGFHLNTNGLINWDFTSSTLDTQNQNVYSTQYIFDFIN